MAEVDVTVDTDAHLDGRQITYGVRYFAHPPKVGEAVVVGDSQGRQRRGRVTFIDTFPAGGPTVAGVRFEEPPQPADET
jgi:hypothetical protein